MLVVSSRFVRFRLKGWAFGYELFASFILSSPHQVGLLKILGLCIGSFRLLLCFIILNSTIIAVNSRYFVYKPPFVAHLWTYVSLPVIQFLPCLPWRISIDFLLTLPAYLTMFRQIQYPWALLRHHGMVQVASFDISQPTVWRNTFDSTLPRQMHLSMQ